MVNPAEDTLTLLPFAHRSIKLLGFAGCFWKSQWKSFPFFEKHKITMFKMYMSCVFGALITSTTITVRIQDPDLTMKQLTVNYVILITNLQIVVMFLKRDKLEKLLHVSPEFACQAAIGRHLKHALGVVRRWNIFKISLLFFLIVLGLVSYLEASTKELIESGRIMVSLVVLRLYSYASIVIFQVGCPMLLMSLFAFINGYLNHLKSCLRHANIRDPLLINVSWNERYETSRDCDMRYCVTMHQFIISLIAITNDVFSWIIQLFLLMTLGAIVFGIKLLQNKNEHGARALYFTILSSLEMLCLCYLADDISRKSKSLAKVCLERLYGAEDMIVGDWRTLQVMAHRCQTLPMEIKAGPFYSLSIRNYLTMLAVSVTLFSFA
ncbi:Hypothetical predicted protein [Cloeon dipterum]|uniref:Odorant receptor n=1 Tax=Cloeon dipterum TaxID=197152 RepID=A0A8S1CI84_9INSE|nr:Hypothetical predicted protein [Cloeon dipterum]